jgi:hypothetical protein
VGAMIVFDVTRISTFEAVAKWKADIDAKVCRRKNKREETKRKEGEKKKLVHCCK